ncbi:MAG TPA: AAA family ATPase [Chthoniobacterales bacterium]|nr:AAA family ATPase [Chthoniobacterales bacterium]
MAFKPKAAVGFLRRAHEQNRLAHAYLISGPPGSGKREVAADLASAVNGTATADVFSSKAHEIFVAEPESKSRRILIEQIRELEHGLQMRGTEGRRKVAIIAEADRLQPQAANAFLKTLEEPPANSLLLLLSALPETLPDTIVSRCISIPLAGNGEEIEIPERAELVELLRSTAREKRGGIQQAYRVAQGFHSLLGQIREEIKTQTAEALKNEEARYRNSTDGAWLEDREEYYKALTESLYIQRRAALVEVLLEFWSDVLRACTNVEQRNLLAAKKETAALAERFTAPEVLRRIQALEELRDNLGRNIQEALAFEVAFLEVFGP